MCGVGGDGIVLLSRVLCDAALNSHLRVKSSENRGHGKRGGAMVSHIRIGNSYSPIIPEGFADVMVAFNEREYMRNMHYLKRGGIVLAGWDASREKSSDCMIYRCLPGPNMENLPQNMFFLGFLSSKMPYIKKGTFERSLVEKVPQKTIESNIKAFDAGYDCGAKK